MKHAAPFYSGGVQPPDWMPQALLAAGCGAVLYAGASFVYMGMAETVFFPPIPGKVTLSYGQEAGLAWFCCGMLGGAAGLAVAGTIWSKWPLLMLLPGVVVTLLVAALFGSGLRYELGRYGWDDSYWIVYPPVVLAVMVNAVLIFVLATATLAVLLIARGDEVFSPAIKKHP